MSPDEFKQSLHALGLTQAEFGELTFSPRRTVVYWAAESVPGPVAAIVRLLERRPELVEVMREIANEQAQQQKG